MPGRVESCACGSGSVGQRTCKGDGTGFDVCMCSGSGGGSGTGSGGGGSGGTSCLPGSTASCYTGPAGTEGIGLCVGGKKTCGADGSAFGPCVGEVTPVVETCATPGDDDCDGVPNENGPGCSCQPGSVSACYSAPPATENVGVCHGGMQECKADGTGFGPCVGEVVPASETCLSADDEDCDGLINEDGVGCICTPSASEGCYDGPSGTEGVGTCIPGTRTCDDLGLAWGPCIGEITPQSDLCSTAADEDCNGSPMPCVPGPTWSKQVGSAANDQPIALALDAQGRSCIASAEGLLVAHDPAGAQLWSVQLPAAVRAVAFDLNGNVVVAGYFSNTVDLGGGPLVSAGSNDIFLVALGAGGMHLWSKRLGGAMNEFPTGLAIDTVGNMVLTGSFQFSTDLGGGQLPGFGGADLFVAKLDASGNHVWSKALGGTNDEQQSCVALDSAGAIVLGASVNGSVDFGGGPIGPPGSPHVVVAKLASDGTHLWSGAFGSGLEQTASGVAANAANEILVTGWFQGTIDLGGGPLVGTPGNNDLFIAKLGSDGSHVWSKLVGGAGQQLGGSVAADPFGNILLTGGFSGTADFGGGSLPPAAVEASFVVKLNQSGGHLWSMAFGDGNTQYGQAIASDGFGYVFELGSNAGTVDFGDGPFTSAGQNDMTLAKLAP